MDGSRPWRRRWRLHVSLPLGLQDLSRRFVLLVAGLLVHTEWEGLVARSTAESAGVGRASNQLSELHTSAPLAARYPQTRTGASRALKRLHGGLRARKRQSGAVSRGAGGGVVATGDKLDTAGLRDIGNFTTSIFKNLPQKFRGL